MSYRSLSRTSVATTGSRTRTTAGSRCDASVRWFVPVALALVLSTGTGCSVHYVGHGRAAGDDPAATDIAARPLRVDDRATLVLRDGRRLQLRVVDISADAVEGMPRGSDATMRIPMEDVVRWERREFRAGRTVLLVAGAIAILYAVAYAGATAALVSGL